MQLAQMGKIPNTQTGTELLLDALDIPDKTAIVEAIQEEAMQVQQSQPPININPEMATKMFKDMPLDCQLQLLAQYGFQVNLEQDIQIEQALKGTPQVL